MRYINLAGETVVCVQQGFGEREESVVEGTVDVFFEKGFYKGVIAGEGEVFGTWRWRLLAGEKGLRSGFGVF